MCVQSLIRVYLLIPVFAYSRYSRVVARETLDHNYALEG